jgi:hypothetical protein
MTPDQQELYRPYKLKVYCENGQWFLEARYGDNAFDRMLDLIGDKPDTQKAPEIPDSYFDQLEQTQAEYDRRQRENAESKLPDPDSDIRDPEGTT